MKTLIILTMSIVITACGGNSSNPIITDTPIVTTNGACLGDSITAGMISGGTIPTPNPSWCYQLKVNGTITNLAVPSKDVTQIYREQFVLLPQSINKVFILTGANDAYHNINKDLFIQEYQSMVDILTKRGVEVYCITALPTHLTEIDVIPYNDQVKQIRGCKIIDMYSVAKDEWFDLQSNDKLHPNIFGYQEMAKVINKSL